MPDVLASTSLVISPMPTAHFGAGAISALPGIVQRAGAGAAVIVTDMALAATPVVPRIADTLEAGGITTVIEAITALAAAAGMAHRLSDFGITPADFGQIAADALDDEVLANTPRMPTGGDIRELLAAAGIA